MAGRLTTHVLDTAQGRPAAGLTVELWQIGPGGERDLAKSARTNAEGRLDAPLLAEGELQQGTYELVFHVGDYFAGQQVAASNPPFLDTVPVRFTVTDPTAHYHIPLLASPWSYSAYRGS